MPKRKTAGVVSMTDSPKTPFKSIVGSSFM